MHNVGRDYRHYFEATWFGLPILTADLGDYLHTRGEQPDAVQPGALGAPASRISLSVSYALEYEGQIHTQTPIRVASSRRSVADSTRTIVYRYTHIDKQW